MYVEFLKRTNVGVGWELVWSWSNFGAFLGYFVKIFHKAEKQKSGLFEPLFVKCYLTMFN